MFAKYLNQKEVRDMKAESARKQVERAERELDALRSRQPAPLEPPFQLLECAAYLARCADLNAVPTCKEGINSLYQVTGAALSYALNDALYFEWVGRDGAGKLYWRDGGLSDRCPLVVLAKEREDQRTARAAKHKAAP